MGCGCVSQNKAGYSKNSPKEFLPDSFSDREFVSSLSAEELEDKDRLLEYHHRLNEGQFEVTESFRDLVRRKGVPQRYRWLAWRALSGWTVLYKPGAYERIKQTDPDPRVVEAVEKDLDRTFPRMDEFDEEKKRQLASIGRSYACLFPQVGYCQGMNFIAGFLLLAAGPSHEDAFYMFVRIMTKYRASLLFCEGLPLLKLLTFQFRALLEHFFPEVNNHFINQCITPELYLTKWILTIFTQPLSLASASRVWDLIVCDGLETLLLVALGTIKVLKPRLLKESTEGVIELLSLHKDLAPPTGGAIVAASLAMKLPGSTLSLSALRSAWAIESCADAAELERGEHELCMACPEPLELRQLPPLPEPASATPPPLTTSPIASPCSQADTSPSAFGSEGSRAESGTAHLLGPGCEAHAEHAAEPAAELALLASEVPGLEQEVEVQVETPPEGSSGSKAPTPESGSKAPTPEPASQQPSSSQTAEGDDESQRDTPSGDGCSAGDGSSIDSSQHRVGNEAKVQVRSNSLSRRPAGGDLPVASSTSESATGSPRGRTSTSCSAQLALREPGLVTASSTSAYVGRMLLQAAASAEPPWPESQAGQQSVAPPAAMQAARPLVPPIMMEETATKVGIGDLDLAMSSSVQQEEGGLSEAAGNSLACPLLGNSSSSVGGSPARGAWQGVGQWSHHRGEEDSGFILSPSTASVAPPAASTTGSHPARTTVAVHRASSGERGRPGTPEAAMSEASESKAAYRGFMPLQPVPPSAPRPPPPQPGWQTSWSVPSDESGRSCDITSPRPDFVVDAQAGCYASSSMSPARGVVTGGQVRDVASSKITRVGEAWGSPRLANAEVAISNATPRSREPDKYEDKDVEKNEDVADAEALLLV